MRTSIGTAVSVLGALFLAGCTSWQPASITPGAAPHTVRVLLKDESEIWVKDARLQDDSLLVGRGPSAAPVSIPLRDIAGVRAKRLDGFMTLTVVVLSLPALFLIALGIAMGGDYT